MRLPDAQACEMAERLWDEHMEGDPARARWGVLRFCQLGPREIARLTQRVQMGARTCGQLFGDDRIEGASQAKKR